LILSFKPRKEDMRPGSDYTENLMRAAGEAAASDGAGRALGLNQELESR
jgi:hypothetical protein